MAQTLVDFRVALSDVELSADKVSSSAERVRDLAWERFGKEPTISLRKLNKIIGDLATAQSYVDTAIEMLSNEKGK